LAVISGCIFANVVFYYFFQVKTSGFTRQLAAARFSLRLLTFGSSVGNGMSKTQNLVCGKPRFKSISCHRHTTLRYLDVYLHNSSFMLTMHVRRQFRFE